MKQKIRVGNQVMEVDEGDDIPQAPAQEIPELRRNAEGALEWNPERAPKTRKPPSDIVSSLKMGEGFRGKPYLDTSGKITVGYGFNFEDNPMTEEEAHMLLQNRIKKSGDAAATHFPWYGTLDPVRQDAVKMLVYNMGVGGLKTFKKFSDAVGKGMWDNAAVELLNSKWRRQVGPRRANEIASLIRTGKYGQGDIP